MEGTGGESCEIDWLTILDVDNCIYLMSLINCNVVLTHVCCVRAIDTTSTSTNKDRLAHCLQHLIVPFLTARCQTSASGQNSQHQVQSEPHRFSQWGDCRIPRDRRGVREEIQVDSRE